MMKQSAYRIANVLGIERSKLANNDFIKGAGAESA